MRDSFVIPSERIIVVFFYSLAMSIHLSHSILATRRSLFCGFAVPSISLGVTLFYTQPHTVFLTKLELSRCVPSLSFFFQYGDFFW